jgi:peptidoglycan/LPS O-acetylase OafA/YrhL
MTRLIGADDDPALRSNNLDALRLALALLVVWSHSFALYLGSESTEWVSVLLGGHHNAGNLAVMGFFILSGFLVTQSYVRSRSLGAYLGKRVRRIYPGYLVATTLCAFVVVPLSSDVARIDAAEVVETLGRNLLLRNHVPPSDAFAANPVPHLVNGSLWTIPFEAWCYVGVALLGAASLATRPRVLVGLLAAVLLARVALDLLGWKPWLGPVTTVLGWPYLWVSILPSFLLGMIAFACRDALPRSRLLLAGLVAAAVAAAHLNKHAANLVMAPALAYLLFFVAFSRTVALPNVRRYGDLSYGTYLYAFPIQQVLVAEFGHQLTFPAYLLASLAASLLAGVASWHLVERWFLPPAPQAGPTRRPSTGADRGGPAQPSSRIGPPADSRAAAVTIASASRPK